MTERIRLMVAVVLLGACLIPPTTGRAGVPCGSDGGPCCTVGELCEQGLACIGQDPGTCEPCGESGQICCPSGRNRVCNQGLGCFGPDLGTCEPCGELGQQCCPFLINRCNVNLACGEMGCEPAQCWACLCGPILGQTVERCAGHPLTVDDCAPCPSGTPGPFLTTRIEDCRDIPACAGKFAPMTGTPALSPIALAIVCLLFVGIAFHRMRRISK